jgi:hypothetical protein
MLGECSITELQSQSFGFLLFFFFKCKEGEFAEIENCKMGE